MLVGLLWATEALPLEVFLLGICEKSKHMQLRLVNKVKKKVLTSLQFWMKNWVMTKLQFLPDFWAFSQNFSNCFASLNIFLLSR